MPTPLRRRAAFATALLAAGLLAPPAAAAASGTLAGRLTDAGAPISGATVVVQRAVAPITVGQVLTDSRGQFRFELAPGSYKVRFDMPGGLSQYHPQKIGFFQGSAVTVTEGQLASVEEQAMPHGSVGGQVTTSSGAPAVNAYVGLAVVNGAQMAVTATDAAGNYLFPFVAAGNYQLNIGPADSRAPKQWARQKRTRAEADPIAVPVGGRTTVDERLLPVGRLSGVFTRDGTPMGNVTVQAKSLRSAAETVITATAADGRFTLQAFPGQYRVLFRAPGMLDQWATSKEHERLADIVTLDGGAETVLEDKALPTGRIEGRLLDAAGQGAAFAAVVVENPALGRQFQATTNADGDWFAMVRPGDYRVRFETSVQAQWAHGKASPAEADPVTVVPEKTTVVNERLTAPGSLAVTAIDAQTGQPLSSFCANANSGYVFSFACTDDGTAEFEELGAGGYTVVVTDGEHLDHTIGGVRVRSGEAAQASALMAGGATIAISVTDAATGRPVANVCVNGRPADRAPEYGEFLEGCTDHTGTATVTRVEPGSYVFFAATYDPGYGAQWVGPHGGVGAQAAALVVTAREGEPSTLRVRMDAAGAIAGVITDQATGQPVEHASILAGRTGAETAADGSYLLDRLGPYDWVIYFSHQGYAGQWPGGGGNRLAASTIRVRAGETTGYDVALAKGSMLTGRITGPSGQPPTLAEVSVVNAKTFDLMHHTVADAEGVFTAPLTGPQQVKLFVIALGGGLSVIEWYPGAEDFGGGQTISVPESGTLVVDLPVG